MDPSSGGSSGNGSRSSLVFSVRGPIPIQLGTLPNKDFWMEEFPHTHNTTTQQLNIEF